MLVLFGVFVAVAWQYHCVAVAVMWRGRGGVAVQWCGGAMVWS